MATIVTAAVDLTDDEKVSLSKILGCSKADLPGQLAGFASADLEEYARMFLGEKVFKRGSDILEYRLLLLIQHAFDDLLPNEARISSLFQITTSQSRSLLRSIMSKYQYLLENALKKSALKAIKAATYKKDDDVWVTTFDSVNVVDALNLRLAQLDPKAAPILRQRDSVANYDIKPGSILILRDDLGIK